MKLDINEVYHNYIVRVIIFSLFTYKRLIRQPGVYKQSVYSFTKKRLPWQINLLIDTGIQMSKDEEREIVLKEILEGVESDYLTTVTVTFTTPLKETTIEVDLRNEEKYQNFLYL
jgi:hypothetical protein